MAALTSAFGNRASYPVSAIRNHRHAGRAEVPGPAVDCGAGAAYMRGSPENPNEFGRQNNAQ
jgi:hypothetical protein